MSEAEFLNSLGTSEYKCALEIRKVLGSLCEARERNGEDNSVFSFNPIKSFTKIKWDILVASVVHDNWNSLHSFNKRLAKKINEKNVELNLFTMTWSRR